MLCGIVADRFAGRRLRRSASTPRSRTLRLRPRPRRRRPSRAWASSRSRLIPFSVEKAKKALDKAVKKEYKVRRVRHRSRADVGRPTRSSSRPRRSTTLRQWR